MKQLYNKINKEELKKKVLDSGIQYRTISFYQYYPIKWPQFFRNYLYLHLYDLGVLGRIYVASEGINAQIAVPTHNIEQFKNFINQILFLENIRLNMAVEDGKPSFYVLKIKVRPKIVADGLEDPNFNPSNKGEYLDAQKFNQMVNSEDTILVDMRNHYESEVGHFKNAWCPDVDTFRDQIPLVVEKLEENKEKKVIMYCTGGIRCEKASAYMKYKGFKNVYHLEGGIINYANQVKVKGLENLYVGKNFVFDERLEEKISDDIIANCHQCGKQYDLHTNCANISCNLLFIQCPNCKEKYQNCCSDECLKTIQLPEKKQAELRKGKDSGLRIFSKGRFTQKTE